MIANVLEFSGFAAAVAMLVACWRKLPAAYTLYALAALLVPAAVLDDGAAPVQPAALRRRHLPAVHGPRPRCSLPRRVWRWVVVGLMGVLLVASTVLFASFI